MRSSTAARLVGIGLTLLLSGGVVACDDVVVFPLREVLDAARPDSGRGGEGQADAGPRGDAGAGDAGVEAGLE